MKFFSLKKLAVLGGLIGLVLLLGIGFAWKGKFLRGRDHGRQFQALEEFFENEGATFVVAMAPYRQRGWKKNPWSDRVRRQISGHFTLAGIKTIGFRPVDLRESYETITDDERLFRDEIHLTDLGEEHFADLFLGAMRSHCDEHTIAWPKRILIAGDCFAEDLVSGLARIDPDTVYQAVRAYGEDQRAVELVAKFRKRYLSEPALVVWLRPELFVAYGDPPKLQFEESTAQGGTETLTLEARILTALDYAYEDWGRIQPTLRYPDAAAELAVEVEGERLILIGWSAKKRLPTGLESLKPGDEILAEVVPFEEHIATSDAAASAYYYRKEESDFTSERYWIQSWARSNYNGAKASQTPSLTSP